MSATGRRPARGPLARPGARRRVPPPRGRRRVRGLPLLALLGVIALGLALTAAVLTGAGRNGGTAAATSVADGPAPALAGRTLAGAPFDLAAERGRVVLVNLFASWCGPCRDELPLLAAAQRRWSDRGLRVVGVDVRDSPEAVRALLAETGSTELTVLPDPAGAAAVDWGARGVPETFLVDRDGRVADRVAGPLTAGWLDQRLAPLLAP